MMTRGQSNISFKNVQASGGMVAHKCNALTGKGERSAKMEIHRIELNNIA